MTEDYFSLPDQNLIDYMRSLEFSSKEFKEKFNLINEYDNKIVIERLFLFDNEIQKIMDYLEDLNGSMTIKDDMMILSW